MASLVAVRNEQSFALRFVAIFVGTVPAFREEASMQIRWRQCIRIL